MPSSVSPPQAEAAAKHNAGRIRFLPQSGSVKPTPPRNSPVANRGRNAAFCCSVPLRCTTMAMIRCELMMPLIDIHTAEMCSMIFA